MTLSIRQVPATAPRRIGDRRTVPFDYTFHFRLSGIAGKTLKQTVTISVEGSFTAVSIGYGAVSENEPLHFGPLRTVAPSSIAMVPSVRGAFPARWTDITLPGILAGLARAVADRNRISGATSGVDFRGIPLALVLGAGIRVNPKYRDLIPFTSGSAADPIAPSILADLFQADFPSTAEIQFTYALFDEGSGREFQSEPVLSTAGLGSPEGERPFRRFDPPVTFPPRSAVRMEVTQLNAFKGELHLALHGYKHLGEPAALRPGGRRTPSTRTER
jgi:hypothetical protein